MDEELTVDGAGGDQVDRSGHVVEELMSLRAYARSRHVSVAAVSKAYKKGRLNKSIRVVDGQPKVINGDLADIEWMANSRRGRAVAPAAKAAVEGKGFLQYAERFSVFRLAGVVGFCFIAGEQHTDDDPIWPMTPDTARRIGEALIAKASQKIDD